MEGPVYRTKLMARDIEGQIPELADRRRINEVIFDELVYGRFEETSRRYFQEVIRRLAHGGCAAMVLGCTEIPLLISDSDSPVPTLDSTRILARAVLREATRHTGALQSDEGER
jgi:aspartate racemase